MKKILVTSMSYTMASGVIRVIKNYYSNIDRSKYATDFVFPTLKDKDLYKEFSAMGNVYGICRDIKVAPIYIAKLIKLMKKNKYDIVHVNANSATAYLEIFAAQVAGIPVRVCHSHASRTAHGGLHKILRPLLNRGITHAVACSEEASKWLFDRKAIILNNAIKTEDYYFSKEDRDALRNQLSVSNKFVILMIGHFTEEKNFNFIIDRFAEILSERPDSALVIIGDGPLRPEYEKRISTLGIIDKVIMPGIKNDANRYYSMADCFILPSLFEGLGMVLVEAQCSGVPCFASTNVPKEANVANGITYIALDDVDAWNDALLKAKALNCEERAKKSIEAIEKIKAAGYDIAQNANKLTKIYGG